MRRVAVAVIVGVIVAFPGSAAGTAASESTRAAVPSWVKTAKTRLSKLKVKVAGSMTGYSRDQFGPEWKDVDRNGCDTRNDILARDLKQIVFKVGSTCVIASGTLRDPYTATTINFVRGVGTSSKVQIDHVVALAAAWRTGAAQWEPGRRLTYANDPLVLLAVDGPANGSKSDRDAAKWLPPNVSYNCRYVAKQVAIKAKYALWVTRPERTKMAQVLGGC